MELAARPGCKPQPAFSPNRTTKPWAHLKDVLPKIAEGVDWATLTLRLWTAAPAQAQAR